MPVVDTTNGMFGLHAAATAAAAGGFLANSLNLGVASISAPAASVYTVTLSDPIDQTVAVPNVTVTGTTCAVATVAQSSDTVFLVSTFNAAAAPTDATFAFSVYRTST